MVGVEACNLANSDDRVFFRRTVLSKEDAVAWYTSLGEGERCTPVPTHPDDREGSDGVPFLVPRLQDDQPWPALGLPITEELFSRPGQQALDAAPFIGSVPGRVHRRFGHHEGLDAFLLDRAAQAFVARRMHVNLFEYQEYLGSAAYIAPDPIIRQIDNFMAPAKDDRGERIIYRFVPRPGQNLEHLRLTTFDKEARLLTSFDTHHVPADGILDVAKGTCSGQYGYVVTHEQQGILAYQPFVGFIRQMNLSVQVAPRKSVTVRVPTTSAKDAPPMEYQAVVEQAEASHSILGEVTSPDPGARVAAEARKRERIALAKQYGQRWFRDNSREEAADFVRGCCGRRASGSCSSILTSERCSSVSSCT
ncbi:VPA1262 family N-terminal domain-containing protein [Achromobacter xylosoxidans]